MKVLFCASEALPFAATGGLADVAGSLPQALRARLIGCRVVMPLYESVPQELRDNMKFLTSISVPVAWRRQYCGIFEAKVGNVIYYLIDNQYYFKRQGLYGHFDDAERFAFFSRAVLEMLPYIEFKPDVIHANDWQTALVPIYYRLFYANNDWYSGIKTLFTIHNIQYQGQYGFEILEDVFGIPKSEQSLLEYNDCVNLMKGAIESANWVSTVSPTYAKEILDPWFAHKLDPILRERAWKLSGILNGIDVVGYDPATDKNLYETYDATHLEGKAVNKAKLQERLGLAVDPDVPLIGMVTRLVSHKGLDLVCETLDAFMGKDVQFVVLGKGDAKYETFFEYAKQRYGGRMAVYLGYSEQLAMQIYAGADLFLMPSKSEPCGLSQMIAMRYGAVPIVRETGGLKDTVHAYEAWNGQGNGFTFANYNAGDMCHVICEAIDLYHDNKGAYAMLQQRGMTADFSWTRSAQEYRHIYESICR